MNAIEERDRFPTWAGRREELTAVLVAHAAERQPLPGIGDAGAAHTLSLQIVASLRRERYHELAVARPGQTDPLHSLFRPEKALARLVADGELAEAAWLAFLMTHFGTTPRHGWKRLVDVYGRLGTGIWTYEEAVTAPEEITAWFEANWQLIGGAFGNHRKYESIRPGTKRSTEQVMRSYVEWTQAHGGPEAFFVRAASEGGNSRSSAFDWLYARTKIVGFGRLGKFDYLALLSRYGIASIEAGSAYLVGATGPLRGARLLFSGSATGNADVATLQERLTLLDEDLSVGMTVMEDALCNWQKSPTKFVHFKG